VMNMGGQCRDCFQYYRAWSFAKDPWVHDRVEPALRIAQPDWVFICYGMNDGNYYPPPPRYSAGLPDSDGAPH
jgi:hypothetical protein